MAQQTAVDYLVKLYYTEYDILLPSEDYAQAKQMEKEQMLNVFQESRLTHPMIGFKHQTFLEYYNETYGK